MTAVVALSLVPTALLLFVLAWQVAQIRRHRAEHAERMHALETGKVLRRHLRNLRGEVRQWPWRAPKSGCYRPTSDDLGEPTGDASPGTKSAA
jgi:hypothetical protein